MRLWRWILRRFDADPMDEVMREFRCMERLNEELKLARLRLAEAMKRTIGQWEKERERERTA